MWIGHKKRNIKHGILDTRWDSLKANNNNNNNTAAAEQPLWSKAENCWMSIKALLHWKWKETKKLWTGYMRHWILLLHKIVGTHNFVLCAISLHRSSDVKYCARIQFTKKAWAAIVCAVACGHKHDITHHTACWQSVTVSFILFIAIRCYLKPNSCHPFTQPIFIHFRCASEANEEEKCRLLKWNVATSRSLIKMLILCAYFLCCFFSFRSFLPFLQFILLHAFTFIRRCYTAGISLPVFVYSK